jgi:CRISPR-associated protein Cmr3
MANLNPVFIQPEMGLIIEPLDTLFFRDGRPFDAEDYGKTMLPTPQTVAGMIRTWLMKKEGMKPSELHGLRDGSHPKKWIAHIAFRGPWLAKVSKDNALEVEDIFVPIPASIYQIGKEEDSPLVRLNPLNPDISFPGWDSPLPGAPMRPLFIGKTKEALQPVDGFLNNAGLIAYLKGDHPDVNKHKIKQKCLFDFEERTGIAISPETLTTEEGLIYSANHLRLKDHIVFYAEIGWETEQESGWPDIQELISPKGVVLPFGGEGRRVLVRIASKPYEWPKVEADGRFLTLLISPAINNPRGEVSDRLPWQPPECGALVAAAVPKPIAISGWDLTGDSENNWQPRPRPVRFAVPAGTVYFWERGKNSNLEKQFSPMMQLAEKPQDRAAGWGIALKGVWDYAGKEK